MDRNRLIRFQHGRGVSEGSAAWNRCAGSAPSLLQFQGGLAAYQGPSNGWLPGALDSKCLAVAWPRWHGCPHCCKGLGRDRAELEVGTNRDREGNARLQVHNLLVIM
jgi:hypothetical protein